VAAGISTPKTRLFGERDEAIRFAESRMGRKGMIVDTTLMSAEQLAAHKKREARAAALLEEMQKEQEG
jgi:hypothetical protein